MLSRERCGLQVAVILFVSLSTMLAVATYSGFQQADHFHSRWTESQKRAEEMTQAFETQYARVQLLLHMLGHNHLNETELAGVRGQLRADSQWDAVQATYQEDMACLANGTLEQSADYRVALRVLQQSVRDLNRRLSDASQICQNLKENHDAVCASHQRRLEQVTQAHRAAQQELDRARGQFAEDRQRIVDESDRMEGELTRLRMQLADQRTEYETERTSLLNRLAMTKAQYERVRAELDEVMGERFPDQPSGSVLWASSGEGRVEIQLESEQQLKRGMTFDVFDRDVVDVEGARRKAKIQIVRIRDQRSADARVLEDELIDPILPGDRLLARGRLMSQVDM